MSNSKPRGDSSLYTKLQPTYKPCVIVFALDELLKERLNHLGHLRNQDYSIPKKILDVLMINDNDGNSRFLMDVRNVKKVLKMTYYHDIEANKTRGYFAETEYNKALFGTIEHLSEGGNVDFNLRTSKAKAVGKFQIKSGKNSIGMGQSYPASTKTLYKFASKFCEPYKLDSMEHDVHTLKLHVSLNALATYLNQVLDVFEDEYQKQHSSPTTTQTPIETRNTDHLNELIGKLL